MYDVIIIGGGPCGATAAEDLGKLGHKVALLDRPGRIKPCGGAIPPILIRDFDIPDRLLKAKIVTARMVSPTNRSVDIPIENGFVGMVDREEFDEFVGFPSLTSRLVFTSGFILLSLVNDLLLNCNLDFFTMKFGEAIY